MPPYESQNQTYQENIKNAFQESIPPKKPKFHYKKNSRKRPWEFLSPFYFRLITNHIYFLKVSYSPFDTYIRLLGSSYGYYKKFYLTQRKICWSDTLHQKHTHAFGCCLLLFRYEEWFIEHCFVIFFLFCIFHWWIQS